MTSHEMTPHEILRNIIQNGIDDLQDNGADADTIADDIIASGFISIHHNIMGQTARYLAQEMDYSVRLGDLAEAAAPAPGEVGRGDAINNRDDLHEDPADWLRNYAKTFGETK